MNAQHTPGPWRVGSAINGNWIEAGHAVQPFTVARTIHNDVGALVEDANARLIAAAPDFYDVACALELLLRLRKDELGRLSPEMEAIAVRNRAAIAKARGQ